MHDNPEKLRIRGGIKGQKIIAILASLKAEDSIEE